MADTSSDNITVVGLGFDTSDIAVGADAMVGHMERSGASVPPVGEALDKLADTGGSALKRLSANAYEMGSAFEAVVASIKRGIETLGVGFGFFAGGEALRGAIEVAERYEELGAVMVRVGQYAGVTAGELQKTEDALVSMGVGSESARQAIVRLQQAHLNLADATRLTAAAQNVAVASGRDLDETEQMLIRAAATGSSFVLRRMGLNVDWKKSTDDLAVSLGKTPDQLSAEEKAQARLNAIVEATIPINGAWAASMETPAGKMRLLGVAAQEVKIRLGEMLSTSFVTALNAIGTALAFASAHMQALLVAVSVLVARGIAPLVTRLVESTVAWGVNTAAMLINGTAAVAVARAQVEAAVGTDATLVAVRALAVAQMEATVTARLLAGAELLVSAAGGPIGLLLIGLGAAYAYLSTQTTAATDMAKRNTDEWQQEAASADRATRALLGLGEAHGKSAEQQLQARAETEKAGKELDLRAGRTIGGALVQDVFHPEEFTAARVAVSSLKAEYDAGRLGSEQFELKVVDLGKALPSQTESLKAAIDAMHAYAAGQREIANEGSKVPSTLGPPAVPLPAPYVIPGSGIEKEQSALALEVTDAMAKAKAAGQGKEAEQATTRNIEATHKATESYQAWAKASDNTIAAQFRVADAAQLTGQAITSLAAQQAAGIAPGDEHNRMVASVTTQLNEAKTAALTYLILAGDLATMDKKAADAARDHANARTDINMKAEIADTRALTAAVGETVAQQKALEAVQKGQEAARALPEGTPTAERQRRGALVTEADQAKNAEAAAKQADDADRTTAALQRQADADAQGVAAGEAMRRTLAAEKAERASLGDGITAYIRSLQDAATAAEDASNKTMAALTSQADDTDAMAAATLQGRATVLALTAAQKAQDDAEKGILGTQTQAIDAAARLRVAQSDANLTAAKSIVQMQEQIPLLEGQAAAQLKGADALKEYQVWMAGEVAVTRDAAGATQEYQDKVRGLAETQARAQQQVAEAKQDEKPLTTAAASSQGDVATYFDAFLHRGHDAFVHLWDDLRDTFLKAIAQMLADDLFGSFIKQGQKQAAGALSETQRAQYAQYGRATAGGATTSIAGESATKTDPSVVQFATAVRDFGEHVQKMATTTGAAAASTTPLAPAPGSGPNDQQDVLLANIAQATKSLQSQFGSGSGSVAGIQPGQPTAQSALGAGVGGFALGQSLASTQAGVGGVAAGVGIGAVQGFAQAGPIGAAIGGTAALVGGIIGLGQAAHAAAEALKEAKIAFGNMLDSFQQLAQGGQNLDTIIKNLNENAGALYLAGKKSGWATADQTSGLQNLENLAAESPAQRQAQIDAAAGPGDREKLRREFAEADQIMKELRQGIANAIADFTTGMQDQIQLLQTGVAGDAQALQQAKEQYEQNVASANAMTNTAASQAALTAATELYNLELKNIAATQALAIAEQKSEIQQFQQNLAQRTAAAQLNTGLANQEALAAQQATELEAAIQKWSKTNPQLITQLEQVQALETAAAAAQLATAANDAKDALTARALTASGQSNAAAVAQLQLQQIQELRTATEQWENSNPELIAQLKQIQAAEMQRLLLTQQIATTDETSSLTARALQAEGFTQQASLITLQQQQVDELRTATEQWGATNPALIAQLKQVQQIELATAAQQLNSAQTNAAAGYKAAQQRIYEAAGTGNPNAPIPGTGTTTPPVPTGQTPGQVDYEPYLPGSTPPSTGPYTPAPGTQGTIAYSGTSSASLETLASTSASAALPVGISGTGTATLPSGTVNAPTTTDNSSAFTLTGASTLTLSGPITIAGQGPQFSFGTGPFPTPPIAYSPTLPQTAAPAPQAVGAAAQQNRAGATTPGATVSARPVVIQLAAGSISVNAGTQSPSQLADALIRELQRRALALTGSSTDASQVINTARV